MRKVYLSREAKGGNEFWDDFWSSYSLDQASKDVENNFMNPIFTNFFSKSDKILEAGCGLGKFVIYYKRKGYDIEGVDFAKETIARIIAYDSSLPVKVSNLENLDYCDRYFDIYYSGGVIEHFEEGAKVILQEAHRVLKDDGLLIITVPYINLLGRFEDLFLFRVFKKKERIKKGIVKNTPLMYHLTDISIEDESLYSKWPFHEYVYTKKEIKNILKEAGFEPIFTKLVQIQWGIKRTGLARNISGSKNRKYKSIVSTFAKRCFSCENRNGIIENIFTYIFGIFFAHQIALVCRKLKK